MDYKAGFEIWGCSDGWTITKAGECLAKVPNIQVAIAFTEASNIQELPVSIIIAARRFPVLPDGILSSIAA